MNDQILISTRKGLFKAKRNGSGIWNVFESGFLGSPVTQTLRDPRDGTLYTALNLGHFGAKLHKSKDDGNSWQEVAMPAFPVAKDAEDGKGLSVKFMWCLETNGSDKPGTLMCGTLPAALFSSDDGGESWQLNQSLQELPGRDTWFGGGYDDAGLHSICVDPRNRDHVAVAVSCGGVWRSQDAGASWQHHTDGMYAAYAPPEQRFEPNLQDPHRMVQCKSQPENFWVQHHNGIFRCTNDLTSWTDITDVNPSSFGFAVVVHPDDGDRAWFVPAVKDEFRYAVDGKFVVTRTSDGGKTFDQLSDGLPQARAYDLVYRHGLDIDATGERLVMGSTSGGLWISENAGDSWQVMPERLPPVYAVRFA